jgi:ATP citrate (pro-S)-lyase
LPSPQEAHQRKNPADNRNSGMQTKAVQGMLDFDFICKRKQPSVAGIIYTFGGQFVSKM